VKTEHNRSYMALFITIAVANHPFLPKDNFEIASISQSQQPIADSRNPKMNKDYFRKIQVV